jgi:hypothetical protein
MMVIPLTGSGNNRGNNKLILAKIFETSNKLPNGQPDFPNMLILKKLGGWTTPKYPPRYGPVFKEA